MPARGRQGWLAALRRTRPGAALVERLGARGQHDTARSPVFGASEVALPWYPCLIRGVYTTQRGRWKAATLAAGKTLALIARGQQEQSPQCARLHNSLRVLVAIYAVPDAVRVQIALDTTTAAQLCESIALRDAISAYQ